MKYERWHYHGMVLQPAAVFAVVRVLPVREVLGHEPQGGGGEGGADQMKNQAAFDLQKQQKTNNAALRFASDSQSNAESNISK